MTPDPHDPRNFNRDRRVAHDPEKISEIGQAVAKKIEFEKKFFGAPWRQNRKSLWSPDLMCRMRSKRSTILKKMKTLGPEMTMLFAIFEIAFGPSKRVSM